jgi:hypothetical protein
MVELIEAIGSRDALRAGEAALLGAASRSLESWI